MDHYHGHHTHAAADTNGVTAAIPDLNGDTHVAGTSVACPEDAAVRQITASPSEFDKYLLGEAEDHWGPVKHELGLEEQTASLTLQERRQEFQQAAPSTSSGVYSSLFSVGGEANGGGAFTDMTSTMRVTREATNALYSDLHLPQPSHNPSELTQYLSRTAVNPVEAQGSSPTVVPPFMNTPSPSSNSDGSHCAYSSPHYSPQHQAQSCFYGTYNQVQNPQNNHTASSPTYSIVSEPSPPTYSHQVPGQTTPTYSHQLQGQPTPTYSHQVPGQPTPTYSHQLSSQSTPTYIDQLPSQSTPTYIHQLTSQSTPTYNHVSSQVTPTYSSAFGHTTPSYNHHQDQIIPTYSQSSDNPPSTLPHRTSQTSPVATPLSTPTHNLPYPEDSKVRNGKMYTTYLNNHGTVVPKYERPTRHPSGPTPPLGHGRVQAPSQYPLPPEVPLTHFFPGFEGVIVPYQFPAGHQGTQALSGFGSLPYSNNYGGQSSITSPQMATQFPASYPNVGVASRPPKGFGGARRKTTYNNNNKGERNRESPKKSPLGSSTTEKERTARRTARKLSRGVIKRKRGCTCYRCQIVFASSGHLKRHLEAHGSNRRFKCSHPFCDVAYSRQDNLKAHVAKAIHRRDGDPYVIPVSDVEDTDSEDEYGFDNNDNGTIIINNLGDFEPNDED